MINPARIAAHPLVILVQPILMLAVALVPWPTDWERSNDVIASIRSAERNRDPAGYYEAILGGPEARDAPKADTSFRRLIGKADDTKKFKDTEHVHFLDKDFLQFELEPSMERTYFGQPFVTNAFGMHDDPVTLEKPRGTSRVAVLGASIDMGWGVKHQDTYAHKLEDWLTAHAERSHVTPSRRFEVLNFGVAAYSPMQRLEVLRRKVMAFRPDMVIFSATTLDERFLEIHLLDMLNKGVDLKYDFVRQVVADAGITEGDLLRMREGQKANKSRVKTKLDRYHWRLYDETVGQVAADCRAAGLPLVMVIIPRVGQADQPAARADKVARLRAIAAHHAVTIYDLSGTFDRFDPASLEVAPWDDHPNANGHNRLFLALAHAIAEDHATYHYLFPHDDVAESRAAGQGASSQSKPLNIEPAESVKVRAVPAG